MTTIRRNLITLQSCLGNTWGSETGAVRVLSASLLLIGLTLAAVGLAEQQGLLLALGAVGVVAALSLRVSKPEPERSSESQ